SWWVWRKGLAGDAFFEDQLRLGVARLDRPHRAEASAMERGQPKLDDRPAVIGRGIAAVMVPAVAGIIARIVGHHPVASDLGDDRGGGDRAAFGVAVDDRLRRALPFG